MKYESVNLQHLNTNSKYQLNPKLDIQGWKSTKIKCRNSPLLPQLHEYRLDEHQWRPCGRTPKVIQYIHGGENINGSETELKNIL